MKNISLFIFISLSLLSCIRDKNSENSNSIESVNESTQTEENKEDATKKRFYELTHKVLEEFETGKIEETKDIVKELKMLIPNFPNNWNYGNAVHKVNLAQGLIALQEGRIEESKAFLIKAGKTIGSPQLNSFGPNMSLAKELLLEGEKAVVIEYLDLCKVFWKLDRGKIEKWKKTINRGWWTPFFGANLEY